MAILEAWRERNGEDELERYEKVAERVEEELAGQAKRISELTETRSKLEQALRRGEQGQGQLESRLRSGIYQIPSQNVSFVPEALPEIGIKSRWWNSSEHWAINRRKVKNISSKN